MHSPLQLVGKLAPPARINAAAAGQLVYLVDQLTGRRFLVDTGASFSLLPHQSKAPPSGPQLTGPAGAPIKCWGETPLQLRFANRPFQWRFLRAAVAFPIIGVDFLRSFKFLVDVSGSCLTQAGTDTVLRLSRQPSGPTAAIIFPTAEQPAAASPLGVLDAAEEAAAQPPARAAATAAGPRGPPIAAVAGQPAVQALLEEFSDVFNPPEELPDTSHGVVHHLRTTGPPVASPFRRLDAEKLAAAKAEFAALERDGIVRRSNSPWASPLHMVRKADGSWRPCGDYRRLNSVTVPDTYPLPNMMDFTSRLEGCKWFSKVDLKKGYHQIPMNAEDIPKTAIVTPFGLFEYTRMTFGMRNAGSTFQRLMDRVLAGSNAFAYLDDVLVASPTAEQHAADLEDLFSRLRQGGLVVNAEKCQFAVPELDFLGHHITAAGAAPLQDRVGAIQQLPPPTNTRELQGFLGTVNFYRRFVPRAAGILRPLTDALRGNPAQSAAVEWTEERQQAFQAAKEALSRATTLAHPRQRAELALMVDASAEHVGAALQQRTSERHPWEPLGFFSQKLSPTECRYSAFDRELFACVAGIKHFRFMLEGRRFTLYTDHKPLTYAVTRVADPWTARQSRHLSFVAEFTSDIRHIPGTDNVVADTLSRPPAAASPEGGPRACAVAATDQLLDFAAIAAAQRSCPATEAAKDSSLQLKLVPFNGVRVLCDTTLQQPRPLIPTAHRRQVFTAFHEMAHPGIRATTRLMTARVVWVGMAKDIRSWCQDCQSCARAKVTKQPAATLQPIPVPQQRFTHVHVDLVGPLPTSKEGFRYLFTMVDRTSRWLEAVPLAAMETAACAEALIGHWVARFGVPARLTSDQGRQFTSALWSHTCRLLGVEHITTTAYHPQSNGMVERVHRQLKDALKARLAGPAWPQHLPWVLLGLRAAPKEDSGLSSAELVYGVPLTLPAQFTTAEEPPIEELVQKLQVVDPLPTRHADVDPPTGPPRALATAELVYVKRGGTLPPLTPPYVGPYKILEKGPKVFKLQVGSRTEVVTVDRLKPHTGPTPTALAAPPRRGRPPAGQRDSRTYAAVVAGGGPCRSMKTG